MRVSFLRSVLSRHSKSVLTNAVKSTAIRSNGAASATRWAPSRCESSSIGQFRFFSGKDISEDSKDESSSEIEIGKDEENVDEVEELLVDDDDDDDDDDDEDEDGYMELSMNGQKGEGDDAEEISYPPDFDEFMKNHVDVLSMFEDIAFAYDRTWRGQIHELVDGEQIKCTFNFPLEEGPEDDEFYLADETPHDVKIILEIPMDAFKLSPREREILIELVGTRFNDRKNLLKITCDEYPTRVFNHKRCCNIVHDLLDAAQKHAAEEEIVTPDQQE